MTEGRQEQAAEPAVPVSFRVSTYWKLRKDQHGITHADSRRLSLAEALRVLLDQLTEEECTLASDGAVSTITIRWDKVPQEVCNPFAFGVKR